LSHSPYVTLVYRGFSAAALRDPKALLEELA
jgi:hypothetical protein